MSEQRWLLVALIFSGEGIGAVVAKLAGVTSWLNAKLYISAGAIFGAFVHRLTGR